MDIKPCNMNLDNTIQRECIEKCLNEPRQRDRPIRSGVAIHRPQMPHIKDKATWRLVAKHLKKRRDGQGSRDKVGERRHFKQDQRPASIQQTTLLIKLILHRGGIFGHNLRTPSCIERRQIGSIAVTGKNLGCAFVIEPGTLQSMEVFARFTYGLLKQFGLRHSGLRHP